MPRSTAATKAAVDAVTRSLAKELAAQDSRQRHQPGYVETEGVHALAFTRATSRKQLEAQTPLAVSARLRTSLLPWSSSRPEIRLHHGETVLITGGLR